MKHLKLYEEFKHKKTILYLHGFKGKVPKDKVMDMQHDGFSVIAPQVYYEENPQWDIFCDLVEVNTPDAIVGHSLGGYMAYYLGQKFKLPTLMLSPAFGYTDSAPDGWDKMQPIPKEVMDMEPRPDKKMAVFGFRDKDINIVDAEKFLREKAKYIYKEAMGHDVPMDKFVKYFKLFTEKCM